MEKLVYSIKGTHFPCKTQNGDILNVMSYTNESVTSWLLKVYSFSNPKYPEIVYLFLNDDTYLRTSQTKMVPLPSTANGKRKKCFGSWYDRGQIVVIIADMLTGPTYLK